LAAFWQAAYLMNSEKIKNRPICHCEPFDKLRINSAKQSRIWPEIQEIATALRASQ